VKVFKHDQQWLRFALSKQEAFTSVQGSLAFLRGIESLPLLVLDGKIQQGEKCRQRRRQGFIEGQQFPGYLLSNFTLVVSIVDFEISLKKIDQW
jgi:hypothetical protein